MQQNYVRNNWKKIWDYNLGLLVKSSEFQWINNAWYLTDEIKSFYDNNQLDTLDFIFNYSEGYRKVKKFYGNNARIDSIHIFFNSGNGYEKKTKLLYYYNLNGLIDSLKTLNLRDSIFGIFEKENWLYNSSEQVLNYVKFYKNAFWGPFYLSEENSNSYLPCGKLESFYYRDDSPGRSEGWFIYDDVEKLLIATIKVQHIIQLRLNSVIISM